MSRKLMRIGKPLEHAQAAVKSLDIADPVLKVTALGRQIGYAGYLVNDMLIWANATKVRPVSSIALAKYNKRAATMWFYGICFSLVSSLYKLRDLGVKEARARKIGAKEKEGDRKDTLKALVAQRAAVRYQLIQDSLDILLPSGTLGYHNLDDGVLGLVGFVSSLMGLRTQIGKVLGVSSK